ncbi:hypothetical protein DRO38_03600 [Candidatus Bathyarchaeota archaeon]|nr:MAG: hypothetical protein DRO38_03600 [Candidatus Bathyarchaeota archaeon]
MAKPPSLKGEVFECGLEDGCTDELFLPNPGAPFGRFSAVLDPARKKDVPVLCIFDKKIKTAVRFYEYDRMPAPDLEDAVLIDCAKWGAYKLTVDETGGGFYVVDHLKQKIRERGKQMIVKGISLAGGTKALIIEQLKHRIESWSIRYTRDPELLRQLENFTIKELDSGSIRYSAPKGDYDDYVDALAIANSEDIKYPYNEQQVVANSSRMARHKQNSISIIHS